MKKIILVLILFLSCYIIYNLTIDKKIYYLALGNDLSLTNDNYTIHINKYLERNSKLKGYNTSFVEPDYRITDMLRMIKYNETISISNKSISINQLLKKADIITLSIGMNEIYYKLSINNDNIYTYIDNMLEEMEYLLKEINRYNHKKVLILSYYSISNNKKDIFTYLNYRLKKITLREGFEYIELDKIFNNNILYYEKSSNFYLNNKGNEKISQIIVEKIKNY